MLSRVHCLYPQALVFVLVIATFMRLKALRRAHRPRRVGTMLWVYLFAVTLELSYSTCLLGSVQCDVVTWYVFCTALALLGLVVLKRDDLIDATLTQMISDEEGLAVATANHRRSSAVAIAVACALTAVAAVLPRFLLGLPGGVSDVLPLVAASVILPVGLMLLGRGGGLGPALASIAITAAGCVQASMLADGVPFSLLDDMGALFSSFLRGQTPLALTQPVLWSAILAGIAVALCAVLFRLPTVVPPEPERPADEAAEDEEVASLPDTETNADSEPEPEPEPAADPEPEPAADPEPSPDGESVTTRE